MGVMMKLIENAKTKFFYYLACHRNWFAQNLNLY